MVHSLLQIEGIKMNLNLIESKPEYFPEITEPQDQQGTWYCLFVFC